MIQMVQAVDNETGFILRSRLIENESQYIEFMTENVELYGDTCYTLVSDYDPTEHTFTENKTTE